VQVNETKETSLSISWSSPEAPEDFIQEFHIYAELNKTFDTFVRPTKMTKRAFFSMLEGFGNLKS
jgi:hypothetical protein